MKAPVDDKIEKRNPTPDHKEFKIVFSCETIGFVNMKVSKRLAQYWLFFPEMRQYSMQRANDPEFSSYHYKKNWNKLVHDSLCRLHLKSLTTAYLNQHMSGTNHCVFKETSVQVLHEQLFGAKKITQAHKPAKFEL